MRKVLTVSLLTVLALVTWGIGPALAQGPDQPEGNGPGVAFYAKYPSQEVAIGETVTFDLTLRVEETAQEFRLEARDLPEGWTPTFRGGGKVIRAVHVEPGRDTTLDLRLDLPDDVQPGTYAFSVVARNEQGEVAVSNPFELGPAIKFGLLFAVILFISKAAQAYLGNAGVYLSSIVAGLTDVDAITLSMTRLASEATISHVTAARAIVLAAMSNTAVKAGIVATMGASSLRRHVLPTFAVILITGVVIAFLAG